MRPSDTPLTDSAKLRCGFQAVPSEFEAFARTLETRLHAAEELLREAASLMAKLPEEYVHKDSRQPLCWSPDGCLARIAAHLASASALAVDEGSALFVWCAEAPDHPGYYALKEPRMLGKLGEPGKELGTPNIHEAIHFRTREECGAWINGNHLWKATEHGLWLRQNKAGQT